MTRAEVEARLDELLALERLDERGAPKQPRRRDLMSNDETRGEDRQNLEAACEAHGWRLRVFPRAAVTGEPPEAIVEIAGAKLSATAATEEEACSRVVAALRAIGGLEVFVA